jgi:hypothetical protein
MKLQTILSIAIASLCLCHSSRAQSVRMKDRSDWWSIINEDSRSPNIKPGSLDLDARNFEIVKLDLATVGFNDIERELGRTARISRGDGSRGREQACYRSPDERTPVFLIFEFGEDQSSFYLFADGAPWKGQSFCTKSKRVSDVLSTASGLHLGLTSEELKTILGKPDAIVGDKIVYSRAVKRKSAPERFERQRKEYPEVLNDRQAHEKFDFYTASVYIEAHFTNSKLIYLVISTSGE